MTDIDKDINKNILNFIHINDNGFIHYSEMEKNMIDWLYDNKDIISIDSYKLFYKHHLDLFIKNEKKLEDVLNNAEFNIGEYIEYRNVYKMIDVYFKNLHTQFIKIYDPKKYETTKESYIHKKTTTFPIKSIFAEIKPQRFAVLCHKLFIYGFYASEMRYFQYKAKHESISIQNSYTSMFGAIFNNYYRRMEKEIEIYCKEEKIELIIQIFKLMIKEFLSLGNMPFVNITIKLLERMGMCNKDQIEKIKGELDMDLGKQYSYLKSADTINGAFISGSTVESKYGSFKLIQDKILKTKEEIMEKYRVSSEILTDDVLVYVYLQPEFLISEPLYKRYKNTIDIQCIKKKCEGK